MTRIALVGTGFIATQHADAYAAIDDAEIVAVASTSDTSEEFAAEHTNDAEAYRSLDALLSEASPDVVDICTPTHTHRDLVETAVEAEVDVLCEKPIAPTLEDATAIADLVRDAELTFMVGHVVRFWPSYLELKRQIEAGEVGDPGVIRARRIGPFPDWGRSGWYADPDRSGGVLVDLSIHDFDYLRWILGPVQEVFVRRSSWEDDGDRASHAAAILEFESGAIAHVEGSWAQPESRPFGFEIEVAGDEGLLEYDGSAARPYELYTEDRQVVDPADDRAMRNQIEHFLKCRNSGVEPRVTATDAVEALRISIAARRSAQLGEPVPVREVEP